MGLSHTRDTGYDLPGARLTVTIYWDLAAALAEACTLLSTLLVLVIVKRGTDMRVQLIITVQHFSAADRVIMTL